MSSSSSSRLTCSQCKVEKCPQSERVYSSTKQGGCCSTDCGDAEPCPDVCNLLHACVEVQRGTCENEQSEARTHLFLYRITVRNCTRQDLRLCGLRLNLFHAFVVVAPDGTASYYEDAAALTTHVTTTCGTANAAWNGAIVTPDAAQPQLPDRALAVDSLVAERTIVLPPGECCVEALLGITVASDALLFLEPGCATIEGTAKVGKCTCCPFRRDLLTPPECVLEFLRC